MRDDDAFWAARRVAAFTDEMIRAAVHTGEYSDPAAEKYLADVLIKRRGKIIGTYLTAVNPIVSPRLDTTGRLTFDNAAALMVIAALCRVRLEHRSLRLLGLEKERILGATAEEEHDPGAGADAPDADHLAREVDQLELIQQHPPVARKRRAV